MNLLAHAVLAAPDTLHMAAGILADRVRGNSGNPEFERLPLLLKQGVLHHRAVDAYTDSHPLLMQAHDLFEPPGRRIVGILLDLYCDYLLYTHWQRWMLQPCATVVRKAENALRLHLQEFPAPAVEWGRLILRHGFLEACSTKNGFLETAQRLGQRMGLSERFSHGIAGFETHQKNLEPLCLKFMDELMSNDELRTMLQAGTET